MATRALAFACVWCCFVGCVPVANLGGHGYPGAGIYVCVCGVVLYCGSVANLGGHGYPGAGIGGCVFGVVLCCVLCL
jgi:hypothetical protein